MEFYFYYKDILYSKYDFEQKIDRDDLYIIIQNADIGELDIDENVFPNLLDMIADFKQNIQFDYLMAIKSLENEKEYIFYFGHTPMDAYIWSATKRLGSFIDEEAELENMVYINLNKCYTYDMLKQN